ncbi:hypothetical protein TWF102_004882 [Orbilia oligospora]|uniref:Uncharacterized protein n=1 Tax=Orbilia oligospora TaxID=2813651 RepID=A0A7C8NFP8_ORBOL|nr:hypothetical protein TWF102_004882 [Orbilia oligospora]KAF3104263.1 hypothetical protein TWF103_006930 [Orbilia oligospora]KAF3126511.1 hypothetical protein TWF594_001096 [Orbilia oligospora]KAF3146148.1 hypothetical protein TWF703_005694 [Orbilia oligospora]
MTSIRPASHAGSWYSKDKNTLDSELSGYLSQVPSTIDGIGEIPPAGARVIIAPHAGYSYSGPAAAWAYKSLNLTNIKRVFILGPSHHIYINGCAVSSHGAYATPLGPLPIDTKATLDLIKTNSFSFMNQVVDSDEHSIEMHLPYTYKMLSTFFGPTDIPPIVPILVGAINTETEEKYGKILSTHLDNPENAFIVSSDFCHWGSRFSYQYYIPQPGKDGMSLKSKGHKVPEGGQEIWKSIEGLDRAAIEAIESGKHENFVDYLSRTRNTVCGRHPIGVIMAGLEEVLKIRTERGEDVEGKGLFKFVRYEQSSQCKSAEDSSVSYASAFAVL